MDYVSEAGTNLIQKWSRKALSVQGCEDLQEMLNMLSKQRVWTEPHFKSLSGNHLQGIGEIRFKSERGIPLRVAGMKGNISGQYILLVGFSKKQNIFDPPKALELARDRKRLLENGKGTICEHEEDDGEVEKE